MNRWTVLIAVFAIMALIVLGCSGNGGSPVTPTTGPEMTSSNTGQAQTHLWGYYDLYFDFDNQSVECVPNRNVMFTANTTMFINGNPANLGFDIFGTPVGVDYIDVDIDVTITHPFPGIHQYDGYDVRGVFMGEGSESLMYGSNLDYAEYASNQHMKDYNPLGDDTEYMDPYDAPVGDPDGYTRWFNASEFTGGGALGYMPGKLATPGYEDKLTATLNPYKYFCDGLDPEDDLWTWWTTAGNTDGHGLFAAGSVNTRNYYLRFPTPTPGVAYGYAVVATWGEPGADDDPADFIENAVEAVACSVAIDPDIYYVPDGSDLGGDFIADVMLGVWDHQPSTVFIETTVHSAVESFDAPTALVGGDVNYSTYHVEFTPDSIDGNDGHEFWVVAEYGEFDYTCDYPAPAPDETLAAFFRYDLYVSPEPYHTDPDCDLVVVTPMPHVGDSCIEFDITGTTYYDGAVFDHADWDFDGDGVYGDAYDSGTDENPVYCYGEDYVGDVCVIIYDDMGGDVECCEAIDVTYSPFFKEDFSECDSTDWYFQTYHWSGSGDPAPSVTSNAPFGTSGSCNVRCPSSGNYLNGGIVSTVVTPPFEVPAGYSSYWFRAYGSCSGGGSWFAWWGHNVKIGVGSTAGLSPFSADGAIGSGVALATATTAHGAGWGTYDGTIDYPSYGSGMRYQQGWLYSEGGGAFPGSLTQYWDVVIPNSYAGQTIKIAYQYQTDYPGYAGSGSGFALDDFELMGQ